MYLYVNTSDVYGDPCRKRMLLHLYSEGSPGGMMWTSAHHPYRPWKPLLPGSCPCVATGENDSLTGTGERWGEKAREV